MTSPSRDVLLRWLHKSGLREEELGKVSGMPTEMVSGLYPNIAMFGPCGEEAAAFLAFCEEHPSALMDKDAIAITNALSNAGLFTWMTRVLKVEEYETINVQLDFATRKFDNSGMEKGMAILMPVLVHLIASRYLASGQQRHVLENAIVYGTEPEPHIHFFAPEVALKGSAR